MLHFSNLQLSLAALVLALSLPVSPLSAQTQPFAEGWTLKPDASALRFQSVKNETKVESSSFATFSGEISPEGVAEVRILLDSVDTKVDLRNVRMRFLLFETFQFPEAVVTMPIDPAILADLPDVRRKTVTLPYTLDLHGITRENAAEVAITLLDNDLVSVASARPLSIATSDHALDDGVRKLEEAANVDIVPSATVSFDFMFARNATDSAPVIAAVPEPVTPTLTPAAAPAPATAAVETAGNFDLAACAGRFEILSRTGNINFGSGSAVLDPSSHFLLDSIVDIVRRCPGLRVEVSGHTDSLGSDATNLRLSERRAASVTRYLESKGADPAQLISVGYGESRPVADNATRDGQRRNRRIEFAVENG